MNKKYLTYGLIFLAGVLLSGTVSPYITRVRSAIGI